MNDKPTVALAGIALIWGLTLAGFALLFALQDILGSETATRADTRVMWILGLCHGLGGALAGVALKGLLGRHGIPGWALALVTAVLITLLGNLIGGALSAVVGQALGVGGFALSLIRIGVGALTVPFAIAELPWSGALWIAAAVLSHLLAGRQRKAVRVPA